MLWKALRYQDFARLFIATLVSEIGSKLHRIALLVLIYTLTGQALWVSLILVIQLAASVTVGPVLAAWADTQERRRLLVLTNLLRAPLVACIPLLGLRSLSVLLLLIFVVEVLRSIHDPVVSAVIPEIVPSEGMDAANGLVLFAQRFAEVAFVGLAGLLVAAVGPEAAFWIDAVSYVLAGLILLRLPRIEPGAASRAPYWERVRQGGRHIARHKVVRRTVGTLFVAALFGSVETVLGVVLAIDVLQAGSTGFGVIEAAMALGAILGTMLVPALTARIPRERLFLLAILIYGLLETSMGAWPVFSWVVLAYLLSGIANMSFIVPLRSILQLHTPPDLRARTFAAMGAIANSAVLLGTLLHGALEKPFGAAPVFLGGGLVVVAVALVVLLQGGLLHQAHEPEGEPLPGTEGITAPDLGQPAPAV
jgi:MFS family permease